jgi:hypothetical protein
MGGSIPLGSSNTYSVTDKPEDVTALDTTDVMVLDGSGSILEGDNLNMGMRMWLDGAT